MKEEERHLLLLLSKVGTVHYPNFVLYVEHHLLLLPHTLSTIISRSQKDLSHNTKKFKGLGSYSCATQETQVTPNTNLKQHSRSVDFILINHKKKV